MNVGDLQDPREDAPILLHYDPDCRDEADCGAIASLGAPLGLTADDDLVTCPDCLDTLPGSASRPERAEWIVCPECQGEGKQVNPILSVWTESDRYDDPEGFEAMLEGRYDQVCRRCNGRTTVRSSEESDWQEREQDRRTRLKEDGIYPGSPDWY